jgi:hypothetical protein
MKVGDLVTVGPSMGGTYIITSLHAFDAFGRVRDAVTLVGLDDHSQPMAMNKKWITIISKC